MLPFSYTAKNCLHGSQHIGEIKQQHYPLAYFVKSVLFPIGTLISNDLFTLYNEHMGY
jgi:hypothetical protein